MARIPRVPATAPVARAALPAAARCSGVRRSGAETSLRGIDVVFRVTRDRSLVLPATRDCSVVLLAVRARAVDLPATRDRSVVLDVVFAPLRVAEAASEAADLVARLPRVRAFALLDRRVSMVGESHLEPRLSITHGR